MPKPKANWSSWLIFFAIALSVAFYRRWDALSWVFLTILAFTGLIRAYMTCYLPRWAQSVAQMSGEEREKLLAHMSPEERQKFEAQLNQYGTPE